MKTKIKSLLNATWKVGLGLIGAGAAVFCILLTIAFCESHYGRCEWRDRTLSNDAVVIAYKNNTVRIKNKAPKEYTTTKIRWVSGDPCEGDSLTVFCDREGKRGYVNVRTGEIVIPAQYGKAWNFSEGLAAVLGGDNCIGFINKDNRLVIDYTIPFEKGVDYVFKDGYCRALRYVDEYTYRALYRKDGSLALDWSHTQIGEPDNNGFRIVGNKDGEWLVDSTFCRVLPEIYQNVSYAPDGRGVIVTKNHIKQMLGFDGSVIEPFLVDETRCLEYLVTLEMGDPCEYKLVPDIIVYRVDGWEGLMDARTGRPITPADYLNIAMASKDLILAEVGYYCESVILDKNGRRLN
ncbi:MAG: WG repeat-containing protein [Candidatus Cryptobacteroides sp.]